MENKQLKIKTDKPIILDICLVFTSIFLCSFCNISLTQYPFKFVQSCARTNTASLPLSRRLRQASFIKIACQIILSRMNKYSEFAAKQKKEYSKSQSYLVCMVINIFVHKELLEAVERIRNTEVRRDVCRLREHGHKMSGTQDCVHAYDRQVGSLNSPFLLHSTAFRGCMLDVLRLNNPHACFLDLARHQWTQTSGLLRMKIRDPCA